MSDADKFRGMAQELLVASTHPEVRTNEDVMALTAGATAAALLAIEARLGELVEQGNGTQVSVTEGRSFLDGGVS